MPGAALEPCLHAHCRWALKTRSAALVRSPWPKFATYPAHRHPKIVFTHKQAILQPRRVKWQLKLRHLVSPLFEHKNW